MTWTLVWRLVSECAQPAQGLVRVYTRWALLTLWPGRQTDPVQQPLHGVPLPLLIRMPAVVDAVRPHPS